jgi:hypothetical protein
MFNTHKIHLIFILAGMNKKSKSYASYSAYLLTCLFFVSFIFDLGHQYEHAHQSHKRCQNAGAEKHFHNEDYTAEHCDFCLFYKLPKEISDVQFSIGLKPMGKNRCSAYAIERMFQSSKVYHPHRGPPQYT